MEVPLFVKTISGTSKNTSSNYNPEEGDEVEDLFELLTEIKQTIDFDAVSSGAILSDYQRIRVENVCMRLNLKSLAYLWRRDQKELMQEMIDNQVDSIIVKVAVLGLKPVHLGKSLANMQDHLEMLCKKYGNNICGEGGEYETFTLDCPLFKKKIKVINSRIVSHQNDDLVKYLNLQNLQLVDKKEKVQIYNRSNVEKNKIFNHTETSFTDKVQNNFNWEFEKCNEIIRPVDYVSVRNHNSFIMLSATAKTSDVNLKESIFETACRTLKRIAEEVENYQLEKFIYVHIYVADMKNYNEINMAYKQFFKVDNPPARVCVACSFSDSSVIFKMNSFAYKNVKKRRVMHVQSISYWAPCMIGLFCLIYVCIIFCYELSYCISAINVLVIHNYFYNQALLHTKQFQMLYSYILK